MIFNDNCSRSADSPVAAIGSGTGGRSTIRAIRPAVGRGAAKSVLCLSVSSSSSSAAAAVAGAVAAPRTAVAAVVGAGGVTAVACSGRSRAARRVHGFPTGSDSGSGLPLTVTPQGYHRAAGTTGTDGAKHVLAGR